MKQTCNFVLSIFLLLALPFCLVGAALMDSVPGGPVEIMGFVVPGQQWEDSASGEPAVLLSQEELKASPVGQSLPNVQEAISLHLEEFYDDYAYYYTHEEFQTMIQDYEGTFGGIGASMINNEDGNIEVYRVLENGPAFDTEMQEGDIILSADGESLLGCDTNLGVTKIRGEVGQPVTMEMRHEDGREYSVTIIREEIVSESVEGEIFEETPNTGYIYIYDFTEQTGQEFIDTFNTLVESRALSRLIIDLRSNGGGSLYAALDIANLFVPAGECLLQEKTVTGMEHYDSVDGQLYGMEIIILVNEYSASASEALAGALRDEANAVLIGSTTYGKGITQSLIDLPSGAGIRFTRSHYYTPSGYDLHKVGLPVDVEVELPEDITRDEYWSTDPALNPCLKAVVDYWAD